MRGKTERARAEDAGQQEVQASCVASDAIKLPDMAASLAARGLMNLRSLIERKGFKSGWLDLALL